MVTAYVIYGSDDTTLLIQLALFSFFLLGWLHYLQHDLLPAFQRRPCRPVVVAAAFAVRFTQMIFGVPLYRLGLIPIAEQE